MVISLHYGEMLTTPLCWIDVTESLSCYNINYLWYKKSIEFDQASSDNEDKIQ